MCLQEHKGLIPSSMLSQLNPEPHTMVYWHRYNEGFGCDQLTPVAVHCQSFTMVSRLHSLNMACRETTSPLSSSALMAADGSHTRRASKQ